jgi:hypothetical protein
MKILLARYHNVIDDIAITLKNLGHEVTICVNTDVVDHNGNSLDILNNLQIKYKNQFNVVRLNQACVLLKQKKYDLLGCDGYYSGDSLLIDICKSQKIPHFCILGYPGRLDSPSNNILSFGFFLPFTQYWNCYPTEGHRKELDWKNISQNGKSDQKNICVFYPNFTELKQNLIETKEKNDLFVSGIHRYEECNKYCYEVFKQVSKELNCKNFESRPQEEFLSTLKSSKGLLMLKHGDMPGISLIQAMLLSKPVFTMKSYVLASMNQEVLIDGFNAVVADTVPELIDRMKNITDQELYRLGNNAFLHAEMLTRFERQKNKLETFIQNCLK